MCLFMRKDACAREREYVCVCVCVRQRERERIWHNEARKIMSSKKGFCEREQNGDNKDEKAEERIIINT